jgi:Transcriptional activator TraM
VKDDAVELLREIAAEHGVALDRGDPVLILQTATRRIVQNAIAEAHQAMAAGMAQHRAELELAASKWQSDAKRIATQIAQDVQAESRSHAAKHVGEAAAAAGAALKRSLERHEKVVARSTLTYAIAAAIVVLAAAALLWMGRVSSERAANETRCVAAVPTPSPSAFLDNRA